MFKNNIAIKSAITIVISVRYIDVIYISMRLLNYDLYRQYGRPFQRHLTTNL